MRIVIADDNKDAADLLSMVLEAEGYTVIATVYDGEAAVRETVKSGADLAILDINMPRKTGYEAACEIHAAAPGTFLVGLSGLPQKRSEARFHDYILKPLEVDRLLRVIKELGNLQGSMRLR